MILSHSRLPRYSRSGVSSGPALENSSQRWWLSLLPRLRFPGATRLALFCRVQLAAGLGFAIFLQGQGLAQGWGPGGSSVNIRWLAPARQSLAIQRQLSFMGTVTADTSTESDSRSPANVFILAGPVNLDRLAQSLLSAYQDLGFGGIVLKRGSNGELLISNDATLPDGTILVDQGNNVVKRFNVLSKPSDEQVIQAILPLLQ